MPPTTLQSRPRLTVVRKKPSIDFSVTGLVYCTMMMFLGLAAVNSQANLLFGVFGLMIGILIISIVFSRIVLRRLEIRRELPAHGTVGQRMGLQYHIENRKRLWPSMSVTLAELDGAEAFTRQPQAYLLHAAPKSNQTISSELIAKRRGLHELNRYQIITSFPFGFVRRAIYRSNAETLLVLPAIGLVDQRVIEMCRSAESSGAMIRPRPGGMDEFYGVKEYRRGENQRWIYWRRSARTGQLVTKEMTHVSPPRIMLLVDTYVPLRTLDAHESVERAIAMAASLASSALEQGMPVGLIAWSGDGWLHIPATRGKRHCIDLLTAMARLPLNTVQSQQKLVDESRTHQKSGTTRVVLTPQDVRQSLADTARGNLVVLSAGHVGMKSMFKFDKRVDFMSCMPLDQQPEL